MDLGTSRRKSYSSQWKLLSFWVLTSSTLTSYAQHGPIEEQSLGPSLQRRDSNNSTPITITNNCLDTIWPAVHSDHGTRPDTHGFKLAPGENRTLYVGKDWKGRIWGRTNCTFPNDRQPQKACATGDCAGALDCVVTGLTPHTIAEIMVEGYADRAFYDISLVDGFNLGMAILLQPNGIPELENDLRNRTNPSCVGSLTGFNDGFKPYKDQQTFLGTTPSDPLPFALDVSRQQISNWCPFDLLVNPPEKPGDGVYPYPDDDIQRPIFAPCYSACAKYNAPKDCCTENYNSPQVCKPGLYSERAKRVCPDAYSFAYDDQDSTFTTKAGAGFEIVLCPAGRSTKILRTIKGSAPLASRSTVITSSASAHGETSAPPWLVLTAAALVVTACVFSSL